MNLLESLNTKLEKILREKKQDTRYLRQLKGQGKGLGMVKIELFNEDCFEGIKRIPDNSVDLVLTDPPYNIKTKQPIELHGRKAMYIDIIEKMGWDNIDIKELYNDIFPEFNRVVKNDGSVIIFVRTEWITYAIESAMKNNFDIKATITWHKTNPIPQVRKKNYLSSTESVLWFARWDEKKCPFTFNFKKQKEMHNFIELPLCGGKERICLNGETHPTQKPLALIKYLLEIHSNENDVVCDPFFGSGTTAVACKQSNRNFIGYEIEKKYVDMANKRLEQDTLFDFTNK